MNLTREEAIKNHRIMWNLLADNPDWNKFKAILEMDLNPNQIKMTCFLCHYTDYDCSICPVDWPYNVCMGDDQKHLYDQWMASTNDNESSEIARQIANLEEFKC